MHLFAISLKLLRSSNEQGRAKKGALHHVRGIFYCQTELTRCVTFIVPPFCLCSLLHVNPVRRRFRHLLVVHKPSYYLARISLRLTVTLCGVVCNLLSHSLLRMTLEDNSAGFTLHKKQFPGLQPSLCRVLPNKESGPNWFPGWSFPFSAYTSLRMSGGAITDSKYRYSTLVGFRHPVPALHALLSYVVSF